MTAIAFLKRGRSNPKSNTRKVRQAHLQLPLYQSCAEFFRTPKKSRNPKNPFGFRFGKNDRRFGKNDRRFGKNDRRFGNRQEN
ncbi:hypothetical protein BV898_07940 [Hypsibius exemplaris]|uniref:Uncharacterized protein n=1 Tax=Hypsibius exemplaris TaxID=2072580 RepID=A0A1W0WS19_HYPEX|nr:hypothetical protein BV898_07940 [Hypsibius exemplaris]